MLFISPHPQFQLLGITDEEPVYHPTNGRLRKTIPAIHAEFFHGGAESWAIEQALVNPVFMGAWKGLPDGVNHAAYVATFDTDREAEQKGWDADTKKFVEDFMLNHGDYGRYYTVAVPPQEITDLPWPSYNDFSQTHHKRIVMIAREIGVPIQKVLDYEITHKNRKQVVLDLEAALQESPEAAEELVPA